MDWRDWLNIAGFALTIIGFGVTFETLRRTKNAAEKSKEASEAVVKKLLQFDAVVEISKAISVLEEVKRLHRVDQLHIWHILLDRYSSLRNSLVQIHASSSPLDDDQKSRLQEAIVQLKTVEGKIEKSVSVTQSPENSASLNRVVSAQIDSLSTILVNLRETDWTQG